MIKGMTLPKGGSKLPLVLGLVLGLVAAVLVVVYLSSAKDETGSTSSGGSGAGVPVVVAASDIAAGTRLSAEMLAVKNVPQSDQLSGAFGSTEGLVGQVTKVNLVLGEQIIQSKVINSETISEFGANPPLALLLEPGQRGVSVQVSSLIGAGGNIRPNDFVDVILIVEIKPENPDPANQGTTDQFAATIVQNVKVLAVDTERASADASASANPDEAKAEDETATTVTLAVSTIQGEVLAMADECGRNHTGRLSIALRGPGDTNKLSNRTEWPADGPPPLCSAVLGIASLGE
ncbi:MAG TPA: Flp pilus assembly protein CpaB [Dehalococcoidia bacterium]|nr:Flp pilus assembly protein CpaB [Dehalococcoidia bacterium]